MIGKLPEQGAIVEGADIDKRAKAIKSLKQMAV